MGLPGWAAVAVAVEHAVTAGASGCCLIPDR